jgi:hypothetical protein
MSNQWKGLLEIIHRYWHHYGGRTVLYTSPYVHISLFFTVCTIPFWLYKEWWSHSLAIIPSILGFTLGGFAVFLGYGSDKFRSIMAVEDENGYSPYMEVVSTFLHFVIVQMLTLLLSLLAISIDSITFLAISQADRPILITIIWLLLGGIGYGIFLYSLLLAFAVSFALYRLAYIYTKFETKTVKQNNTKNT